MRRLRLDSRRRSVLGHLGDRGRLGGHFRSGGGGRRRLRSLLRVGLVGLGHILLVDVVAGRLLEEDSRLGPLRDGGLTSVA